MSNQRVKRVMNDRRDCAVGIEVIIDWDFIKNRLW